MSTHNLERLCEDGLREREIELLMFLCKIFPFSGADTSPTANGTRYEFLDINPAAGRMLSSCWDWGDEGAVLVKKSPWKSAPGTLTGSQRLVVRSNNDSDPSKNRVRLIEAVEVLAMQGWHESWWRAMDSDDRSHAFGKLDDQHKVQLVCNMAGNAFCIWHFLPLQIATLATVGKFGKLQKDGEMEPAEVIHASDEDDCRSSSSS